MGAIGNLRNKSFKLVLSQEEHAMLLALAAEDGISAASWLRQRLRQAWIDRWGPIQKIRPKKKRKPKK